VLFSWDMSGSQDVLGDRIREGVDPQRGLRAAMIAHVATDIVLHVFLPRVG